MLSTTDSPHELLWLVKGTEKIERENSGIKRYDIFCRGYVLEDGGCLGRENVVVWVSIGVLPLEFWVLHIPTIIN
jgi:hypothetical protein